MDLDWESCLYVPVWRQLFSVSFLVEKSLPHSISTLPCPHPHWNRTSRRCLPNPGSVESTCLAWRWDISPTARLFPHIAGDRNQLEGLCLAVTHQELSRMQEYGPATETPELRCAFPVSVAARQKDLTDLPRYQRVRAESSGVIGELWVSGCLGSLQRWNLGLQFWPLQRIWEKPETLQWQL